MLKTSLSNRWKFSLIGLKSSFTKAAYFLPLAAGVFLEFLLYNADWFKMKENIFASIFGLFAIMITQIEAMILQADRAAREIVSVV